MSEIIKNPNEGNKEKIQRVLEIEKELAKRKEKNLLKQYNSGELKHLKQIEFHKCEKRNRWVFGGNRSGKTECGAVEAVWLARGNHPYKQNRRAVHGWVVSLTYEVQRDVSQAKVLKYLNPDWIHKIVMRQGSQDSPEAGVIDIIYVKNELGGISKIGFKSCDQGREKFQGASLDFVWFDEEPPHDIYEECAMRVMDRRGIIFGTMTPLKGLTWVYEEIYLNPKSNQDIWYTEMEWADNPYLHKDEITAMERLMGDDTLESRRFGRFRANEGLVYTEFDSSIHVIEPFSPPFDWQAGISIDPGLNNPLSCHFYYKDYDGNIYVGAEHYEKGKDISHHSEKILKMADDLNWHRGVSGMLEALIDSSAGQRTLASQKSVAELFFERGIAVDTRVNKDLWSGIATVKEYFAQRPPKIFIFKNCVNLIREIKGYWWGGGDNPIKKDDHALDELRYFLMSRPLNTKPKQKPSLHQKHKESMIKLRGNSRMNKQ
ncbi:MAG: terminase family protein [Firmicutes bacterium]|nr:terminase family protein [Bacillota bacterium]